MPKEAKNVRITVELSPEEYERLHAMKYMVSGARATHADIMRAGLRLLFDAQDASAVGDVIGTGSADVSAKNRRMKQVLVRGEGWGGRLEIRRWQAPEKPAQQIVRSLRRTAGAR